MTNTMTNLNIAKSGSSNLTLFQIAAHMEIPGLPRFTVRALALTEKELADLKMKAARQRAAKTKSLASHNPFR
ncbi:MAG: hypothetical protein ABSF34_06060 [Verrucomicrobiota bacterium]